MTDDHFGNREEMIARYRALQTETGSTIATLRADLASVRLDYANECDRARRAEARSERDKDELRADLARVEAERDEARAKVAGLEAAMPTNDEHRLFVEAIDRAFYDEASKYDAAWAALRRLIEACDRRDLYAEALGGGK